MKKITLLLLITSLCLCYSSQAQKADSWTRKADFGAIKRFEAVAFSIGNKGYVGSGNNGSAGNQIDFWEYDPATDTWTQKADFAGTARIAASGFSIDTVGYIALGVDAFYRKDLWLYSPSLNTWTRKADFGGAVRAAAAVFVIDHKAYIGTGTNDTAGLYKDFWEYNPVTDTWTKKADFGGAARWDAAAFSIGDKGYIGTGQIAGAYSRDFWQYDPATDTWTKKADYGGYGAGSTGSFSLGPWGYIGTGVDYTAARKQDFWLYEPVIDQWIRKADFGGSKRHSTAAMTINNRGYLACGFDGDYRKDFWQYMPDSILTYPLFTDLCSTDTFNVYFNASVSFSSSNIFNVQLSDASGSFTSPTIIGTLSGTIPDTIPVVIPASIPPGTGYRIRVVSSSPAAIGADNGQDLALHTSVTPSVAITASDTNICAGDIVTFEATGLNTGDSPVWIWRVNGIIAGPGGATVNYAPTDGDIISCSLVSNAICSKPDTVTSTGIAIKVNALPLPTIIITDTTLYTQKYVSYQWYLFGKPIAFVGDKQSLPKVSDGDYYVSVTDSNGCSNTSSTIVISGTGIDNTNPAANSIGLYPNPSSDIINVTASIPVHVRLCDLSGKTLINDNSQPIHINSLANGMYLLYIYNSEGHLLDTRKIRKQ